MARAKTKKSVNLMVQLRWDGRTGTATEAISVTHGRKGFRGYVGPHDTIRGYRSPKHKVIPGSQGKPTPETLYKVVWHSGPAAGNAWLNAKSRRSAGWTTSSARTVSSSISNEILIHLYGNTAEKDYYSLGEITILTREN